MVSNEMADYGLFSAIGWDDLFKYDFDLLAAFLAKVTSSPLNTHNRVDILEVLNSEPSPSLLPELAVSSRNSSSCEET